MKLSLTTTFFAFALIRFTITGQNQIIDLVLPTDNNALFSGGSSAFYQYVERNYKGVKSTPWEGGQYGFVRDPTDTPGGVVYTRFHLMLSHHFEEWHAAFFKNDVNHNGIYNGMNLSGLDIARLYLALRKNPSLTIPDFLKTEEVFYKVTLPNSRHFELPKLYPWMLAGADRNEKSSWEISFARSGLPLRIESRDKHITQPELSYVKKSSINYSYVTRDVVSGSGAKAQLTSYGAQLMRLLIWPEQKISTK